MRIPIPLGAGGRGQNIKRHVTSQHKAEGTGGKNRARDIIKRTKEQILRLHLNPCAIAYHLVPPIPLRLVHSNARMRRERQMVS